MGNTEVEPLGVPVGVDVVLQEEVVCQGIDSIGQEKITALKSRLKN